MALYDAGEMRIMAGPLPAIASSRYGEGRRIRWLLLAAILGAHIVLGVTLDLLDVLPVRTVSSELKLIQLSPEAAPPPPAVVAKLPEAAIQTPPLQRRPIAPQLDAPPPIVPAPNLSAPVIAPPAPAPVQSGPIRIADLDARAVTVVTPKYPVESRRKREQGTAVLMVTLTPDGGVDAVEIVRSSGFERLDKAALDAVRRWRWSPTLRDGMAVGVKGMVEIPFILQG